MQEGDKEDKAMDSAFFEQILKGAVSEVQFPVSKAELINRVGKNDVHVREGVTVPLDRLIQTCTHTYYDRPEDFVHCPEIEEIMRSL